MRALFLGGLAGEPDQLVRNNISVLWKFELLDNTIIHIVFLTGVIK
jgi:hypothetical protein